MVVFTCSACGESLKKKDVEKHYYTKCRSCNVVTCIDCNKDFWGDTYKEHIKCVTEAERYGGKDFKAPVFKGEAKQQEWIDLLSNIASTSDVSPRVQDVFQRMLTFNNIPRKEKPFKNFLGSSMGVRNPNLAEEVWKAIQAALQSAQKSKPGNSGKQQPAQQDHDKSKDSTGDEKPENNGADKESTKDEELPAGPTEDDTAEQKEKRKKKAPLDLSSQDIVADGETEQQPGKQLQNGTKRLQATPAKKAQAERAKKQMKDGTPAEQKEKPKKKAPLDSSSQDIVADGETQQQPKKQLQNGTKRLQATPAKKAQAENAKKQMKDGTPVQKVVQKKKLVQGDAPSEKVTEGKQAQQQQPKKRKSDGTESQLPAKKKKLSQENGSAPESQLPAKKKKLSQENGSTPEEGQAAKKHKLQKEDKDSAAEEAEGEQESVKKAKFKWRKAIKQALQGADNCQLSMKLLKKRVFNEYRNQGGILSEEDMQTKFDKVLTNQRYFEHDGGNVRYVHVTS